MTRSLHRPAGDRPPGPDPARLARLVVTIWLEVRAGHRPLRQLRDLVAPALLRRLAAQLPGAGSACGNRPSGTVRRVVSCDPRPGACEASVIVESDHRISAVAVRLEIHHGTWRIVELTAPEAGLPALRTASSPVRVRPPDAFDEVLGGSAAGPSPPFSTDDDPSRETAGAAYAP